MTSRFAHNVVTTRAVNHANTAKEVSFDVELPKTAFITNFTLWVSPQLLALGREGSLAQPEPLLPQLSISAGPLMVLATRGRSRRRKLPRSNMRRPCPRARQLAWSSKCGPPGLGENVRAVRALRDTNKRTAAIIITWQNVL